MIAEVTETFARHEGKPPKGWMGAGTYENPWTPDLLKEAGYTYVMDWPHDDQPIWMRTRSGPILSVPYPAELNDSPQIIHRQHTAREFCDMLVDQFEEMVEQSAQHPLVCNISIHPYVFGYPVPPAAAAQGAQALLRERSSWTASGSASPRTSPTTAARWSRESFRAAEHAPVLPGKQSGLRSRCAVRWRRPGSDPVKLLILRHNPARHRRCTPRSLFARSFLPSPAPNRAQPAAYAIELHSACSADLNP